MRMIRKLIQLSPSTAVVSLPAKWLRRHKLSRGAELSVEERDDGLLISGKGGTSLSSITADMSDLAGRLAWAKIDALYIVGYDRITLLTRGQEQNALFTRAARQFPGLMVTDERKNSIELKDIAEGREEDLEKILSRIFHITAAMLDDGKEAARARDWKTLAAMKSRDYAINSYVSYCFRQLNKHGFSPASKMGIMHTYIKLLEILADRLSAMLVYFGERKTAADPKVLEKVLGLFRNLFQVHSAFSIERLNALENERNALKDLLGKKIPVAHSLAGILDIFYDLEELELQLHS